MHRARRHFSSTFIIALSLSLCYLSSSALSAPLLPLLSRVVSRTTSIIIIIEVKEEPEAEAFMQLCHYLEVYRPTYLCLKMVKGIMDVPPDDVDGEPAQMGHEISLTRLQELGYEMR